MVLCEWWITKSPKTHFKVPFWGRKKSYTKIYAIHLLEPPPDLLDERFLRMGFEKLYQTISFKELAAPIQTLGGSKSVKGC
jgi:hypothetical protein